MIKYDPEKNPYKRASGDKRGARGRCVMCDAWISGSCVKRPYVETDTINCPACSFSHDRYISYQEGYEQALRDVEKQVKQFSGWICPNCGPLNGREVTYEETCERCGHGVK